MIDVVVFGAGLRGLVSYGTNLASAGLRPVAVVDPIASRRDAFGELFGVPADQRFAEVGAWSRSGARAPGAIVATPDLHHVEPAVAALEAGCDVLVEKPLAPSIDACVALVERAEALGRRLHVCHVLRFTPFFRAVREVVASGRLGSVVTVAHREDVDARHFAHSYVRGAYRREDGANPFLLAKSCHDLDLLHWLLDDPAVQVASFGSLQHFRAASVGPEVPERCTDGCPVEATCAFSAIAAYAPPVPVAAPEIRLLTQVFPLADPPSFDRDDRLAALATSPFGRCAYRCDNDVVDHQVVALQLASGASVTFTVHGHSHAEERGLRIDGTEATLRASFREVDPEITVHRHGRDDVERIPVPEVAAAGHGGGDLGVLQAFAASLAGDADALSTDGRTSLESHLLGWAAEQARRTGTVVDVDALRRRHRCELGRPVSPP